MELPHLAELVRRVAGLVALVHCRLLRRCRHAVCSRLTCRGGLHAATARACARNDIDGEGVHAEEGESWPLAGPGLQLCCRSFLSATARASCLSRRHNHEWHHGAMLTACEFIMTIL